MSNFEEIILDFTHKNYKKMTPNKKAEKLKNLLNFLMDARQGEISSIKLFNFLCESDNEIFKKNPEFQIILISCFLELIRLTEKHEQIDSTSKNIFMEYFSKCFRINKGKNILFPFINL